MLGRSIEYGARSIYPGPTTEDDSSELSKNNKKEESRTSVANGSGLDDVQTQLSQDFPVRYGSQVHPSTIE